MRAGYGADAPGVAGAGRRGREPRAASLRQTKGVAGVDEVGGAIRAEFTHQAEAFARASVYQHAATLEALLRALPLAPGQAWLDVACGPGIVSRALAGRVGAVVGVDLTPAMVAKATAEAAGLPGLRFVEGDAAALPFPEAAFDGAVTRFSLHHIPAPARVVREMARVVRPGGTVAVADHLTSADPRTAAWHHDIERLRDPSHWLSLAPEAFFGLGGEVGGPAGPLEVVHRETRAYDIDFEEWLTRGSGGPAQRALITRLLAEAPPEGARIFGLADGRIRMELGIAVWRRRP